MNYSLATGVTVTQKDIRMLQLGKSAVCAGIRTLLEAAGLTPEALTELSVAGGFGTYLDIRNAAAIGLYPAELEDKTKVLGNAALAGIAGETGSIQPGKCADMIVCAADPLADLTALRTLDMVIKSGYRVEHPQVKKMDNVERELDKFL